MLDADTLRLLRASTLFLNSFCPTVLKAELRKAPRKEAARSLELATLSYMWILQKIWANFPVSLRAKSSSSHSDGFSCHAVSCLVKTFLFTGLNTGLAWSISASSGWTLVELSVKLF